MPTWVRTPYGTPRPCGLMEGHQSTKLDYASSSLATDAIPSLLDTDTRLRSELCQVRILMRGLDAGMQQRKLAGLISRCRKAKEVQFLHPQPMPASLSGSSSRFIRGEGWFDSNCWHCKMTCDNMLLEYRHWHEKTYMP